jgi:hypothetical protein
MEMKRGEREERRGRDSTQENERKLDKEFF